MATTTVLDLPPSIPPLDFPPNTAFPTAPAIGQKHPQPPVSGQPVYTWDGYKWTTFGGTLDSGGAATALPLVDADTALVGLSTKYAREDHVHPKFAAAQVDALAYNGLQINGAMDVCQERGLNSSITASGYVCDGWGFLNNTQVAVTASVGTGYAPSGFLSAIVLTTTRATPIVDPTSYVAISQAIEGYRMQRLGWGTVSARPITIGFWTAHHRTGTYSVTAQPSASNRSFITTYTQNVADAWEYKVVTINGDTAGTWDMTTSGSIRIYFPIYTSPDVITGTINVWNIGGFLAAPGQVNGVVADGDVCRFTGVTMQPGYAGLDLTAGRSPLLMRPYGQELVTCQRYYRKYFLLSSGYNVAGGGIYSYWTVDPTMRIAPTITLSTPTYSNSSGLAVNTSQPNSFGVNSVIAATGTGYVTFYATLDARV